MPCSEVLAPEQVADDPQVQHMNSLQSNNNGMFGPVTEPRPPYLFSGTPVQVGGASPGYGEHTAAILQGLGFSEADIAALEEAKSVQGAGGHVTVAMTTAAQKN